MKYIDKYQDLSYNMHAKQIEYCIRGIFFLRGNIPSLLSFQFSNLAKTQIPGLGRKVMYLLCSIRFVWRQSEFAFFGALAAVGAPFYISFSLKKQYMKIKKRLALLLTVCGVDAASMGAVDILQKKENYADSIGFLGMK